MDSIVAIIRDHPLLATGVMLTLVLGILHELRIVLELLIFVSRLLRRELTELVVQIRRAKGVLREITVDVSNADGVSRMLEDIDTGAPTATPEHNKPEETR